MHTTPQRASRPWLGFSAVLTAMTMNILDSTIVNVAAPAIRADLGGSLSTLQWTVTAYTLALAAGLLTGGRLGDLVGRRRALLVGVAGFVAASLVCGLAWSPGVLIAARVAQGLSGALLTPQAFGLIRDLFPPGEIGKAFAALGPVIGLSTVLGPVVAGALIQADVLGSGWRSVFLINLPMGAYALVAGRAALPRSAGTGTVAGVARSLDAGGALLAATGMFLLVYPLVQGREQGWPAHLFAMLAAAVAVLAGFARHQVLRRRSGRPTLVELSVLAHRSYLGGVLFVLVFFGTVVGFGLAMGLFLQLGLGFSAMRASLTMTTWAVGAVVGSGFSAARGPVMGRRVLHLGLGVMALGLAGVLAAFGTGDAAHAGPGLLVALGVYGAGMGMIFVPVFDIIMGEVRDHEVGSASSLLESLQQLGASLGVAVLGTVLFGGLGARPAVPDFVRAGRDVTLLAVALCAASFALAWLLPRHARRPHLPEAAGARPDAGPDALEVPVPAAYSV